MYRDKDVFQDLSEEEIREKEEKVRELDFDRSEVWVLYKAALKTLLPVVIFLVLGYVIFWLIFKLWLGSG